MEFEWDDAKAASNLRKHRVAFEDAISIFDDRHAVEREATTVDGEPRFKRTGLSESGVLLTIIYTWRTADGSEVARVISARPASRMERRLYGDRTIPAQTSDD